MQIQVNTDNHIEGSIELTGDVESVVMGALERFGSRITRVEVHLSDQNGDTKSATDDKRCVMEARLSGLQPIIVTHQGSSLEQAVSGATDKLEKTLESTLGRLDDRKSHAPHVVDVASETV
mgnify:CR=1 FL=1